MAVVEETHLCAISILNSSDVHRHCLPGFCVQKNGVVCLHAGMRAYLSTQTSIYQEFKQDVSGIKQETDWDFLTRALDDPQNGFHQKVLTFVSSARSYRLRFRRHRDSGVSFVTKLLRQRFDLLPALASIGGSGAQEDVLYRYQDHFEKLCTQAERTSSGGVYRLYDLCEGKPIERITFSQRHFLSLLFAFGHGKNADKPVVDSVSNFVGRYQFYDAFAKEAVGFLQSFLKFEKSAGDSGYLMSSGGWDFARNLWNGFLAGASQLYYNTSVSLYHDPQVQMFNQHAGKKFSAAKEAEMSHHLRTKFSSYVNLRPFGAVSKFHTGFHSKIEAAYHPFKHQDVIDDFLGRGRTSVFNNDQRFASEQDFIRYGQRSITDYWKVISQVITEGKLVKVQPNQFDLGSAFRFELKMGSLRGRERIYSALVKVLPQGFCYLLTCF